jgi:chromate reductase
MKVLGISGSLRKGSFNTAALHAGIELAPSGMTIEIADISGIPLYNHDVQEMGFPEPVSRLEQHIRDADALLFAVPEYNYSVPGVLKNVIDWISRVPKQPFAGKPAAMLGASNGLLGASRAHYHFNQIAAAVDLRLVNRPEVMIGQAPQKFDANGRLTDEKSREFIGKLLMSLEQWTTQLRPR